MTTLEIGTTINVLGTDYPLHPVCMTFPDHDPETYAQLLHSVQALAAS